MSVITKAKHKYKYYLLGIKILFVFYQSRVVTTMKANIILVVNKNYIFNRVNKTYALST